MGVLAVQVNILYFVLFYFILCDIYKYVSSKELFSVPVILVFISSVVPSNGSEELLLSISLPVL